MKVIETDTADVQVDSAGTASHVNGYKVMDMLGEGTFSKVYLCQSDVGTEFALKVINKSILKRKREYKRVDGKLVLSNAFQKVQKEVAIMKRLAHSSLVRLYEVIDSPEDDKLFLVLELIRGGQVMYWDDKSFRYFSRDSPSGILDRETVRRCMHDIIAALDYLHQNRICHRDIKPENILLSGDKYKLADFGVAYMSEDEQTARLRSTEGTYHFLAPECTTGEEYDPYLVDIWALGVTMFTLLVGTLPFGTGVSSLNDVMTSIREDTLTLPAELDPECSELLRRMMEKNPCWRITLLQLKTHPWVTGVGGSAEGFRRIPSNAEVLVTQQEIEAAFTPVNNFILMTKLKIKMSSRLTIARKSLAENAGRGAEAAPATTHIVIPSSELRAVRDNCNGGAELQKLNLMPNRQPQMLNERSQGRSTRMSETIASLTTTFTRRKSQSGAVSPTVGSGAIAVSSFPSKAETNCRPSLLSRSLSKHNTQSARALITSTEATRGGNRARQEEFLSDEMRQDQAPDKTGSAIGVSLPFGGSTMAPLDENKSPAESQASDLPGLLSQRMIKRKSTLFQGMIRTSELPKYAAESESPINKRKKGARNGPNATSIADEACNPSGLLSRRRLSRRTSTSFRTLLHTELPDEEVKPVDAENLRNTASLNSLSMERSDTSSIENSPRIADCTTNTSNITADISPLVNDSGSSSVSPKLKVTIPTDEQPPRKAHLPALDLRLSPISSPGTSPMPSPRMVADFEQETFSGHSTPRQRISSPPKMTGPVRLLSTLEVSTLQPSNLDAPGSESKKEPRDSTYPNEGQITPATLPIEAAISMASTSPLDQSVRCSAEIVTTRSESPTRRATILALPDQERSSQSRPRHLHRNRSMCPWLGDDDPNTAFARTTSLLKVLDEYLISSSSSTQIPQKPSSTPIESTASSEINGLVVPTTPTKHQMSILGNEDEVCQTVSKSKEKSTRVEDESQQFQAQSLASVTNPGATAPSLSAGTSTPDKSRLRRRSLIEAHDSLRVMFRGRRPSVFGEKREPNYTASEDKAIKSTKAKVCAIM